MLHIRSGNMLSTSACFSHLIRRRLCKHCTIILLLSLSCRPHLLLLFCLIRSAYVEMCSKRGVFNITKTSILPYSSVRVPNNIIARRLTWKDWKNPSVMLTGCEYGRMKKLPSMTAIKSFLVNRLHVPLADSALCCCCNWSSHRSDPNTDPGSIHTCRALGRRS